MTTDNKAPTAGVLGAINAAAEALVAVALLGELAVVLANVFARAWLHHSFLWSDEVARFALSVLAFLGGAVAYRRRDHAFVRAFVNLLPTRAQDLCFAAADLLVLFSAALTGIACWDVVASTWSERTPILQVPAALIVLPLPVGLALIVLHAAEHLWREHRHLTWKLALVLAGLLAAAAITREMWLPWMSGNLPITLSLFLFFLAIVAGVPVGFVLLLATAAYIWTSDSASMLVLAQSMANGTGNFILLAVPFFILAGLVMERGGISVRLIRFIRALVGHLRGGLLQVAVVSMYIVSGLSGSKPADVAAVGTVMRDELRERHGSAEGAAVLAASAIMGETVPPSIAMLIVGSITNVSVAAMFIGGLIPAAVMALSLMVLIYVRARRSGEARIPRAPRAEVMRTGLGALLPLAMPGMLLGGILSGVATPTEVAGFAVVYGLVLAVFVYREMDLRSFIGTVVDTAALTGVLLFIFAAASGFSWTLTVAYLPQRLVELLHGVGNSTTIFMIGSIVLLIVVGVLLEGLPSLNVLAPLLLPIAGKLGMSGMHYALVLIIAMGVGGFMPLAGVGFYVCCAIMRTGVESASRAMVPYLAVILVGLLIVAFVPWFALFLPNLFGFRG
ncbi:MAG: TRAP transporter large permease subunit [Betaproteobacteria bacterium]|nr:TRAP transporter large permease subunit [Betaproteobacteria bacterium]